MAGMRDKTLPSEVMRAARKGDMGSGPTVEDKRQRRADYRAEKELDEARKQGQAAAIKDFDTGRDINPHIPQFISDAPWYAMSSTALGATLQHQRPHPEREAEKAIIAKVNDWYKRGTTDTVATKFRKGACENCGAMTHAKRDCFERPRKVGAKHTGEDIAPDEFVQPDLKLDYDSKRDAWNGYDPKEHAAVIEEYQRLEEARKILKAEQEKADEDEDKYAEHADMPGVKTDMDSRTRITVRNLRIREDTAKYLYNLDPNSAHYDPKSRSMRENPFAGTNKEMEAVKFMGENFVKFTGEVIDVNKAQLFAWEARRRGIDAHSLAEPTKLQRLIEEFDTKKTEHKTTIQSAILDRYGGEEHLKKPKDVAMSASTEAYVEYDRQGKIISGDVRPVVHSRYEEDNAPNNHEHVFGSWYSQGAWGYACCHQTVYNSYCTGQVGISAADSTANLRQPLTAAASRGGAQVIAKVKLEEEMPPPASRADKAAVIDLTSTSTTKPVENDLSKNKRKRKESSSSSDSSSSGSSSDSSDDDEAAKAKKTASNKRSKVFAEKTDKKEKDPLAAALTKARREAREADRQIALGDRQREYNKNYEIAAPTEHDMEAYRLTHLHADDPMAAYISKKKK